VVVAPAAVLPVTVKRAAAVVVRPKKAFSQARAAVAVRAVVHRVVVVPAAVPPAVAVVRLAARPVLCPVADCRALQEVPVGHPEERRAVRPDQVALAVELAAVGAAAVVVVQ